MDRLISSIHYCPVKSLSFQNITKCKIKKNIGISDDRIFAFFKYLDFDKAKIIKKSPQDRKGKWNNVLKILHLLISIIFFLKQIN